jgi:hypothetical protein
MTVVAVMTRWEGNQVEDQVRDVTHPVVGYLAARDGRPVDRLACGCTVDCTREGTTEAHVEACRCRLS